MEEKKCGRKKKNRVTRSASLALKIPYLFYLNTHMNPKEEKEFLNSKLPFELGRCKCNLSLIGDRKDSVTNSLTLSWLTDNPGGFPNAPVY